MKLLIMRFELHKKAKSYTIQKFVRRDAINTHSIVSILNPNLAELNQMRLKEKQVQYCNVSAWIPH